MTITPCKGGKPDTDKLGDLFKDLVSAQFAFGKELLGFVGGGARAARDALGGIRPRRSGSCCDIPEACWMPKPLGEVTCRLKPGATGDVRLQVTNGDYSSHQVTAQSAGPNGGLVQFTPSQIVLGPKERTTILARFTAPKAPGTYEVVLWVTVCSDHYLRWTVEVVDEKDCRDKPDCCCFDVTVDDTPDHVVHWYDHFYCPKPCLGRHGKRG